MPIIALSYGSGVARDLSDKVTQALGYRHVGQEVIRRASERFGMPEEKLSRALRHGPSLFGMSAATRKRCVACILAAAAEEFTKDNVVYSGPAAYLLGQGISHVLRVRVVLTPEARAVFIAEKDGISNDKALALAVKEAKEQQKTALEVFGLDDSNPGLYDLVLDMSKESLESAVDLIRAAVQNRKYRPMTYSVQYARSMELAHRVKVHLVDIDPDVQVRAEGNHVFVRARASAKAKEKIVKLVEERAMELEDVEKVEVQVAEDIFEQIAGSMR